MLCGNIFHGVNNKSKFLCDILVHARMLGIALSMGTFLALFLDLTVYLLIALDSMALTELLSILKLQRIQEDPPSLIPHRFYFG